MGKSVKKVRIHLSLYVLIPLIFSGLTIIAAIVTYRLMARNIGSSGVALVSVTIWATVFGAITFVSAFLILWFVLKPLEDFLRHTESLNLLQTSPDEDSRVEKTKDEVQRYSQVLTQVTNLLTRVEAKELFPNIVGQSRAMRAIFTQLLKVAPTDSTVLITGESGTGKELVATSIYEHSRRKGKPFVKINCVAIPEGLLESELFGHEKGAFTGATAQKKGKFEIANGGTVFLDEIGDMPEATQAKLLRVLQEKEFERVGGTQTVQVDIRFVAATNKDIQEFVREHRFREDLYYRLNVFALNLPPLRERIEDIPLLTEYFLTKVSSQISCTTEALQMLVKYPWPGNVRELQNVVERAAVLAESDQIGVNQLPIEIIERSSSSVMLICPASKKEIMKLDEHLDAIEKSMIIEALSKSGGIQARAAELLGINQRSLWHRVKKFGIDTDALKGKQ
jgi:transcriptional regulator with GAF, ATPase, and Fis domain